MSRIGIFLVLLVTASVPERLPATEADDECHPFTYFDLFAGELGWGFAEIQYFNIDDLAGLKTLIQRNLGVSIVIAEKYVTEAMCGTEEERNRIDGMIRLLAVQHEVYPVDIWSEDEHVTDALNRAKSRDMGQTEAFRARDWSKQF